MLHLLLCLSGYFLFQKDKLPQEAFIALETIPEDTASETTPQIKDEARLVKVVPKDSARVLISREHKIQEVVSPPAQTALEDTGHTENRFRESM